VLRQLPNVYRAQVQSNELKLHVEPRGDVTWRGDHTDLERALGNLVDNAMRYGRSSPNQDGIACAEITVTAARQGNGLAIEVTDRGSGVPEDQLERLLRPFARLDTARGGADGAGLGLAIVARLARRYGGSFDLSNVPGGGLRAQLILPDA